MLGVDHQYRLYTENGVVKVDPTVKSSYFNGGAMNPLSPVFNPRTTLAFQAVAEYAKKNNICIMNATRGGKLEVFEWISLENILSDVTTGIVPLK